MASETTTSLEDIEATLRKRQAAAVKSNVVRQKN